MGLDYPGGVRIDALAQKGDGRAVRLPRPLLHDGTLNFSFSGLKTAMLQHVTKHPFDIPSQEASDVCASFQEAVCDVLAAKTEAALLQSGCRRLVVAGGVACNSGLRARMARLAASIDVELHIPAPPLCGDNAAMQAVPGDYYLESGISSPLSLDAVATWEMDRIRELFS
jgi:N6-L-threonylcarbamoyladenine synthase